MHAALQELFIPVAVDQSGGMHKSMRRLSESYTSAQTVLFCLNLNNVYNRACVSCVVHHVYM